MKRVPIPVATDPPPAAHPPRRIAPSAPAERPPLTGEQIAELRESLIRRRAELVADIDAKQHEERLQGREVGDEMDEASNEGAAAMTSRLLERDVQLLNEIDHALAKLPAGAFGVCEGTGEPIGYERLRLRPWARYSVEYQEELEHQARSRGTPGA